MRFVVIMVVALAGAFSLPAQADEVRGTAVRAFGAFEAYWRQVEDQCARYFVHTDPTNGYEFTPEELERAKEYAAYLEDDAAATVKSIGCDQAARDTAALRGMPFLQVWTVKGAD